MPEPAGHRTNQDFHEPMDLNSNLQNYKNDAKIMQSNNEFQKPLGRQAMDVFSSNVNKSNA